MWTIVYLSSNWTIADQLKQRLEAEGILVRLRSSDGGGDVDEKTIEIVVPESEAEEAHELLAEVLVG